jgi:hypothetical protein
MKSHLRIFNQHGRQVLLTCLCVLLFQFAQSQSVKSVSPAWPTITRETKPWTRWWWHGSAVTKQSITAEMEAYKKAGLGGLEITPIYGVVGYEKQFVDYLSPKWMELLMYTLKEAERLDMGIDMATGTGWPFGGPWVKDEDACKDMNFKVYDLRGGSRLPEKIEFVQQPLLRAIGNPVYGEAESQSPEKKLTVQTGNAMRLDPKQIQIEQIKEPVGVNKNLQDLALDQIKFKKQLKLQVLMAYGPSQTINLTNKVDPSGALDWTAPVGEWKLYAVFEGWHGKMVERAGPGGEGNVIDHFSAKALRNYLHHFDSAFAGNDINSLRAFFNDSYEVDDARGNADWTPTLFEDFKKLKGYDLRDHLPALFAEGDDEISKRVRSDFRETISELVLTNFTMEWKNWAHGKNAVVRNQAHGAPSNILDLYATVDIPEIEGEEPLRIRMASSAGNVTGKKLVSSESVTWLDEHFLSNLSDIKVAVDRFMLNGVNHIFYHGTSYSPVGEPWPGWLFYAAVHLNPRNSLWKDFDVVNNYVARCQSFLQNSLPDNDVLLYYPIYDRFAFKGPESLEHFDGIGRQFANTAFERAAQKMASGGYAFDYISDKQILSTLYENGSLKTEGNSLYKTIVIPHPQYIPLKTFQKIISLAEQGTVVMMMEGLPVSYSGYADSEKNKETFDKLLKTLTTDALTAGGITEKIIGNGKILIGDDLEAMLDKASIRKESLVSNGLQFIRKKSAGDQQIYFVANGSEKSFAGWLPLTAKGIACSLYDPMTGRSGVANVRQSDKGAREVYIQLNPQQSLILVTGGTNNNKPAFNFYSESGKAVALSGKWKIRFVSGGEKLPVEITTDSLKSWTTFGNDYASFSGTASYTLSFNKPKTLATYWMLNLGTVYETAEVILNGKPVGKLIGPTYQVYLDPSLLKEHNVLEVKVSNLMANRIIDMDKRKVLWKKFYNVNIAARKAENRKGAIFDASNWQYKDSGLMGPVQLVPLKSQNQ